MLSESSSIALVTTCRGAAEGALSVVRTLGRHGVPVAVLSDDAQSVTRFSRYCQEFILRPHYTKTPQETLGFLLEWAAKRSKKPVLFPTSDPDLLLLTRLSEALAPAYDSFLGDAETIEILSDKRRFHDLALAHGFPVPDTLVPQNLEELANASQSMKFPIVLKPSTPDAWTHRAIQEIVSFHKALVVSSRQELIEYYKAITVHNSDLLVQEYIEGSDDKHYSLHVYMNHQSEPLACFIGQKVRIYPAHAGSGCFVRSVYNQELIHMGTDLLKRIGYTGIAVINFKQDERTGDFRVHEINPRVSQWNILATACGADIPFTAYTDTIGMPTPKPQPQSERLQYVHLQNDLRAFRTYRRDKEWSLWSYVKSLFAKPTIHQLLALDDLRPFWTSYTNEFEKITGWIGNMLSRRSDRAPGNPQATNETRNTENNNELNTPISLAVHHETSRSDSDTSVQTNL